MDALIFIRFRNRQVNATLLTGFLKRKHPLPFGRQQKKTTHVGHALQFFKFNMSIMFTLQWWLIMRFTCLEYNTEHYASSIIIVGGECQQQND